jgi:REP element-mobilizing transposase RayT
MREPLAYFLTWTTYGTWLPGDARGWVDGKRHEMHFTAAPEREERARALLVEPPVTLTSAQRLVVEQVIRDHCRIRGWILHVVNVRTNHVHVVVSIDRSPKRAMNELKAWCTRHLKRGEPGRQHWWSEGGSKPPLWTEDDLETVVAYVRDWQ